MRFAVLLLPWLELLTLIELGVRTSALTALAYVFATALLGMAMLQRQGLGIVERLRQAQYGRTIGADILLDDMAMGFAGILLMIPGILTDLIAILVLIGPLRRRLARAWVPPSPAVYVPEQDTGPHQTIEGEFHHVDDDRP